MEERHGGGAVHRASMPLELGPLFIGSFRLLAEFSSLWLQVPIFLLVVAGNRS